MSVSSPTDSGDCGDIENTVTVSADGDINLANNTDDGDITVNCPDVKVEKDGNGTIDAGQDAEFDIVVTNLGPGAASDVDLSDTLPAGFTWILSGDDAGDCSLVGLALTCDFETLLEGETRSITLTAATDSGDCGDIDNTVTITATGDINALNDTDSDTVTVRCGALQITKTAKHFDDSGTRSADLSGTFTVVDSEGNSHDVEVVDGVGCVDGIAIGMTQSITEDAADFPGYSVPYIANVDVLAGECDGDSLDTGGTDVPVENTPLTDITWSVDSLVDGATNTIVTCYDDTGAIIDGYPVTVSDGTGTLPNLLPTDPNVTITCEFIVDP